MAQKTKSNNLLYVTILSALGILSILALSLNQVGLLDPAVVYGRELVENGEPQDACADSDPLNKFDVKGEVKFWRYQYSDICIGDKLHQVFCDSSQDVRLSGGYVCPNGCSDGVCLS